MGKGIDLARDAAPEHAQVLDDFKDQLILVMVKRLGKKISIPVSEVDETGKYMLEMAVKDNAFHFNLREKH